MNTSRDANRGACIAKMDALIDIDSIYKRQKCLTSTTVLASPFPTLGFPLNYSRRCLIIVQLYRLRAHR